MTIKQRSFNWEKDFELVRSFLIETYKMTHSLHNWIPIMFENIKFGQCGAEEYQDEEDEYIKIWEEIDHSEGSSTSTIVAVVNWSPPSRYFIQIHPDYRYFEKELVFWIEKHSKDTRKDKTKKAKILFTVEETDEERITLLTELCYENLGLEEYNRTRSIDLPLPGYELPAGFTIKQVDVEEDYIQYKKVLESVFRHCGRMTENMAKIYASASFYKAELDLVAVDPNGRFAAFVTVRLDPVSRIAELEPVGTHPDYRKLGLAKAVILEGLKRLQKYNPSLICIQGAAQTEAANRLYESLGFTEKVGVYIWQKTI